MAAVTPCLVAERNHDCAVTRDALNLAFGNGRLGLVDAWPKGVDENEEPTHRAWIPVDEKRERDGNRVNASVT
jgi:hypothetical protein